MALYASRMDLSELIRFLIIGFFAGWIAGFFVRRGVPRQGFVAKVVVGMLGAVIGGFLFEQLDVSGGAGFFGSLFTATVGAVVLLVLIRLLRNA